MDDLAVVEEFVAEETLELELLCGVRLSFLSCLRANLRKKRKLFIQKLEELILDRGRSRENMLLVPAF